MRLSVALNGKTRLTASVLTAVDKRNALLHLCLNGIVAGNHGSEKLLDCFLRFLRRTEQRIAWHDFQNVI